MKLVLLILLFSISKYTELVIKNQSVNDIEIYVFNVNNTIRHHHIMKPNDWLTVENSAELSMVKYKSIGGCDLYTKIDRDYESYHVADWTFIIQKRNKLFDYMSIIFTSNCKA